MTSAAHLRQQVVAAFKGFLLNHRLEPTRKRTPADKTCDVWHGLVRIGDEDFDFYVRRLDHERLLELIERLYPGQTHRETVSGLLIGVVRAWFEAGGNKGDQPGLEQAAEQLLTRVEEQIRSLVVFVPVEGLDATFSQDVQLARCHLCRNSPRSELMQAVSQSRQRVHANEESPIPAEQAPAYFKVGAESQFKRALEWAREEAELAMDVLRLFLSSFYFDVHQQSVPRQIGILGTRHEGKYGSMYVLREGIPVEDQSPGFQESYRHVAPYRITSETIAYMRDHGLDKINVHLRSLEGSREQETARSLLRAITWFGKAATAGSIAESFLMYAISIEALLSGGDRTPKETYGERIAALVTRADDEVIFPIGGSVSRRLGRSLNAAADRDAGFTLVYNRAVELFGTRNDIAHGAKLEGEIDALDLLDFETLVRNSILSFVDGGWNRLGDFKQWMGKTAKERPSA